MPHPAGRQQDLQLQGNAIWHFLVSSNGGCPVIPMGAYADASARYHSHFSVQYANGIVGAIQINGPASADYDIDLGPYLVSDWYHRTADVLQLVSEQATGPPPHSDNVLFNGSNINPAGAGGAYNKVKLTPGKKHLVRLINPSAENHFTLSLVGHTFTVIAADLVPVKPVVKSTLFLAIGQRYDVIIEATQPVGNYWFNATLDSSGLCGLSNNPFPAAIFSYQGAPDALPTDPGARVTANCHDTTGFTPVVGRTLDPSTFEANEEQLDINLSTAVTSRGTIFQWLVNGSTIDVEWDKPILQYIAEGNNSFPTNANVVELHETTGWTYVAINNLQGGLVSLSPS